MGSGAVSRSETRLNALPSARRAKQPSCHVSSATAPSAPGAVRARMRGRRTSLAVARPTIHSLPSRLRTHPSQSSTTSVGPTIRRGRMSKTASGNIMLMPAIDARGDQSWPTSPQQKSSPRSLAAQPLLAMARATPRPAISAAGTVWPSCSHSSQRTRPSASSAHGSEATMSFDVIERGDDLVVAVHAAGDPAIVAEKAGEVAQRRGAGAGDVARRIACARARRGRSRARARRGSPPRSSGGRRPRRVGSTTVHRTVHAALHEGAGALGRRDQLLQIVGLGDSKRRCWFQVVALAARHVAPDDTPAMSPTRHAPSPRGPARFLRLSAETISRRPPFGSNNASGDAALAPGRRVPSRPRRVATVLPASRVGARTRSRKLRRTRRPRASSPACRNGNAPGARRLPSRGQRGRKPLRRGASPATKTAYGPRRALATLARRMGRPSR